jgi:DNA-binding MarR family transcriptional regulator
MFMVGPSVSEMGQAQQAIVILAKAHGLTVVASAPQAKQASVGYPIVSERPARPDPVPDDAYLRTAKAWLRASGIRQNILGKQLGTDPAWDMLLSLYVDYRSHRKTSVTGACAAAGTPPSTALRWLKLLEAEDWIVREDDQLDRRRSFVRLVPTKIAFVERALAAAIDSDSRLGLLRMSLV